MTEKLSYFNENKKKNLFEHFTTNSAYPTGIATENFEKTDFKPMGVKVFDTLAKNLSSATTYNLISNLDNEKLAQNIGYDGKTPDAYLMKQIS
jgi:hypothetical protein